ncbi:MAG: type II toxin-antitoxin system HicB family antitoxin [bacterium]
MTEIEFDAIVFQQGKTYVAYCPELDVSSCGEDVGQARDNLRTAVRLFVEEAEKMETLADILQESGYQKDSSGQWKIGGLNGREKSHCN